MSEALGIGIERRILVIDAIDILDEAHAARAEAGSEEDRAEISPAAAQGDNTMFVMSRSKAWHDDNIVEVELCPYRLGIERLQVGIERITLGNERHFMRIKRAGGHSRAAERERHHRCGVKLPYPGEPRDQRRGPLAPDPAGLIEEGVGLASQCRHDSDYLFAFADMAINFRSGGRIILLRRKDGASELEDAQSLRNVLSCLFHRFTRFHLA